MNKLIAIYQMLSFPFRREITGRIENKVVVLDYAKIHDAELINCEIAYGGGSIDVDTVSFNGCSWSVFGTAASTLRYLKSLNSCGADDVIKKTFGYDA